MTRLTRQQQAIADIAAEGFLVVFVDYCESARTPGFLGQIAGVTDRERREVRIASKSIANRTPDGLADTLEHELRHVREPEWDCGNRDVLGRDGAPMTTYGQSVSGEERHDGARPRARADGLGTIASPRPGHLAEFIAAEVRERWHDRAWYRGRRDIAAVAARSYEGALDRSGHWQSLIDENDRELRTLLRVLRKARR